MAADEDEAKGGARQRPPVTIDLAAGPAKDERPAEAAERAARRRAESAATVAADGRGGAGTGGR